MVERTHNTFGGDWTVEKLDILERYLNSYTTALKNQSFGLMYIDAFAGSGTIGLNQEYADFGSFVDGSAARAIGIDDKPFDRLIFIEKDTRRYLELDELRSSHPNREIQVVNFDAGYFLQRFSVDWQEWRGVLFLDPFATEVKWETIERVESFQALDTWILFPVSAVARMLPLSRRPDDISEAWALRLSEIFGDNSWQELYSQPSQGNLFGDQGVQRDRGVDEIVNIYKSKLRGLFGSRFLEESITLRNSRNSPLFEFLFCVGNSRGIGPAKRIAQHLVELSR